MTIGAFPLHTFADRRSWFIPRQGGLGGVIPATGWADNASKVTLAQAPTITTITSVTVTPKVSGRLRVEASGQVTNLLSSLQDVSIWLGRSASQTFAAADYVVLNAFPIDANTIADEESFATVVRYDIAAVNTLPLVFPLGVPVTIFLLGNATASNSMAFQAHQAQLDVLEVRG